MQQQRRIAELEQSCRTSKDEEQWYRENVALMEEIARLRDQRQELTKKLEEFADVTPSSEFLAHKKPKRAAKGSEYEEQSQQSTCNVSKCELF